MDKNVINPFGLIPTKNLMVLWCLQANHVYASLSKDFDCLIKISAQSRITRQFEYLAFLKTFGKFCRIASLGSQTTRACPNNWRNNLIQVANTGEHKAGDMQNISAKSLLSIPRRSLKGNDPLCQFLWTTCDWVLLYFCWSHSMFFGCCPIDNICQIWFD